MSIPERKFTIVTVVFEKEYELLLLQARSMRLYVDPDLVSKIFVIDNSKQGMPSGIVTSLKVQYGHLYGRISLIRGEEVWKLSPMRGWQSQQLLKLGISSRINTPWYVVIDAKNHLVAPLREAFLIAPDDRMRVNVYSYENHSLRKNLEAVLIYLGLSPEKYIKEFTATVTPFVFKTEYVKALIEDMISTSGCTFEEEFISNNLTEFLLYSGFLIKKGYRLEDIYDFHQVFCPNIWAKATDLDKVKSTIAAADMRGTPFFSVHRRAFLTFSPESIAALSEFWAGRRLFDTKQDAYQFAHQYQNKLRKIHHIERLRIIPSKILRFAEQGTKNLLKLFNFSR